METKRTCPQAGTTRLGDGDVTVRKLCLGANPGSKRLKFASTGIR